MKSNEKIQINPEDLAIDFEKLAICPGPTQLIAKISGNDPRIAKQKQFPIFSIVNEIKDRINSVEGTDLVLTQHHGNLILVGGLGYKPTYDQIYNLPVTLASHLDEITFMVSKKYVDGKHILIPLCKPPEEIRHHEVKILNFRENDGRELAELGEGKYEAKVEEIIKDDEKKTITTYLLETDSDVKEGDIVVQNYGPAWEGKKYDIDSILHIKAVDDRAGAIAHIYAVKELSKLKIPVKAILTGAEEGRPVDVSWDRLIRKSVLKYCKPDGIILICDGIDGSQLKEFEHKKGTYLSEALILPYTSHGVGPGDLGVFSILRDSIIPLARDNGFEVETTTDYVSRSTGPKIMDEFPLIGYIDWVNGKVLDVDAVCHEDESILIRQLVNVIGTTVCAVSYFHDYFK